MAEEEAQEEADRETKRAAYSIWNDLVKFKFVVAMLLTPLADPLVMMILQYMASDEERANYIDSDEMMR